MRNIITNRNVRRLLENLFSLSFLQLVNNIIPLLLFPYLVRVLGIEEFGRLSFVLAVIAYGMILTDYGFDLSATKLVSIHRDNPKKITEIFNAVLIIKALLGLLYFLIVLILILSVDRFAEDSMLYFLGFGMVVGEILFPTWFFQGIEQMRYITIVNSVTKIFFTLLIFLLVKTPDDIAIVLILNASGAIIAAVWALKIATDKMEIAFVPQSRERLLFYLKDGWYIFTSRIAVELYMTSNVIILGFFVSNSVVGQYAVAEKTIRAIGRLLDPVTRTLYPYLAKRYHESKEDFYRKNRWLAFGLFLLLLPLAGLIYLYTPEILALIADEHVTPQMLTLMHIMTLIIPIALYGSQFTNMLVTLDETRLLNQIVFIAGVANLFFAIAAIHFYGAIGLAWLSVIIAYGISIVKGYYTLVKFPRRDLR